MDIPDKFTYPFCYTPHPLVAEAAASLIKRIDSDKGLTQLFSEGKMLGVLLVQRPESKQVESLFAFSGLARGHSRVEGFVPPIYDTENLKPAASSEESKRIQDELFSLYVVHNARGESR